MERFKLGGVPGVTPAKWLRVWAERLPEVPIELVEVDEADAVAAVVEARVDAALVRLGAEDAAVDGLHLVRLYQELPVVVAAKGHPIVAFDTVTTDDLAGETVLEQGELSLAQLLETVATGAGIAIVPMAVARALGGPETRHRVVTDLPTTTIALVWSTASDSPLHQELVGIVRGRRPGSSRGDRGERADRGHRVEPGASATGAKPRASKPAKRPATRPRRPGGPGRSGRPGPGRR